jgi:hypothetical protein
MGWKCRFLDLIQDQLGQQCWGRGLALYLSRTFRWFWGHAMFENHCRTPIAIAGAWEGAFPSPKRDSNRMLTSELV